MASPITVRAYVGKGGRYVRGYTRRSITAVTMKGGGGGQVGWRSISNSRGRALTIQAPGDRELARADRTPLLERAEPRQGGKVPVLS
jgi:hypothetical protein